MGKIIRKNPIDDSLEILSSKEHEEKYGYSPDGRGGWIIAIAIFLSPVIWFYLFPYGGFWGFFRSRTVGAPCVTMILTPIWMYVFASFIEVGWWKAALMMVGITLLFFAILPT